MATENNTSPEAKSCAELERAASMRRRNQLGPVDQTSPPGPMDHVPCTAFITPHTPQLFQFDYSAMEARLVAQALKTDAWPGCFELPGKDNRRK